MRMLQLHSGHRATRSLRVLRTSRRALPKPWPSCRLWAAASRTRCAGNSDLKWERLTSRLGSDGWRDTRAGDEPGTRHRLHSPHTGSLEPRSLKTARARGANRLRSAALATSCHRSRARSNVLRTKREARVGSSHFILYRCHLAALGLLASTSGYDRLADRVRAERPSSGGTLTRLASSSAGSRRADQCHSRQPLATRFPLLIAIAST
jgi:hypothetical protein